MSTYSLYMQSYQSMDKNEKYNLLTAQVRSLAAGETNHVGLLANVAAA